MPGLVHRLVHIKDVRQLAIDIGGVSTMQLFTASDDGSLRLATEVAPDGRHLLAPFEGISAQGTTDAIQYVHLCLLQDLRGYAVKGERRQEISPFLGNRPGHSACLPGDTAIIDYFLKGCQPELI